MIVASKAWTARAKTAAEPNSRSEWPCTSSVLRIPTVARFKSSTSENHGCSSSRMLFRHCSMSRERKPSLEMSSFFMRSSPTCTSDNPYYQKCLFFEKTVAPTVGHLPTGLICDEGRPIDDSIDLGQSYPHNVEQPYRWRRLSLQASPQSDER